jgi:UPF0755 protein
MRKFFIIFFFLASAVLFFPGLNNKEMLVSFENRSQRLETFNKISVFPIVFNFFYAFAPFPKGEWLVPKHASVWDVLKMFAFQKPRKVVEKITFIPGMRASEILARLNTHPGLSGAPIKDLQEGVVFPETFFFKKGTNRELILNKAIALMKEKKEKYWKQRSPNFPLSSHEWIVLASIIEKEAHIQSELPMIAGVYLARLRKNMRLQSCPTILYITKKTTITKSDLFIKSDYNTYRKPKLPPSAICIPSESALKAVIFAKDSGNLFFVWCCDHHEFSKTFQQHLVNKARCRSCIK